MKGWVTVVKRPYERVHRKVKKCGAPKPGIRLCDTWKMRLTKMARIMGYKLMKKIQQV